MSYPKVVDEWGTIRLILSDKLSIARFGDGEFKICRGGAAKAQEYDQHLSDRLREVLVDHPNDCLVAIPNIRDLSHLNEQKQKFWRQYQGQYTLFNGKKRYYSSFITRPDSAPIIDNPGYFAKIKSLWADRRVCLIAGTNKSIDKDPTIFNNVDSWIRVTVPNQHCYSEYSVILNRALAQPKDTLIILSCGPTATVLAWDLCAAGYQALDLGHLGMFYARMTRGATSTNN